MADLDPDAALKDIRYWLAAVRLPGVSPGARDEMCARVTVAVGALDEWLSKGGALPREWMR